MAWYDDPSKTTFVGTYANEKQFRWDLDAATKRGWTLQASEDEDEPMIGAPPKTKIQVTFVRQEDWLVNRKREVADSLLHSATRAADEKDARHVKATDELALAEEALRVRLETVAVSPESGREQAERDLLGTLKDVIARRRAALKAKEEAIKEMDSAVVLGAAEFARSVAMLKQSRESELARLETELALLPSQELVVKAAKEWREAGDRRMAAEEQLRKRTAEHDAKTEAMAGRAAQRNELAQALKPGR
ncbi:MAG: hypothetical protein IT300_00270 [Dehalococcoidia bacterium]|nr:hypothetical protein [Dehalococcoidia bacterium]